MHDVVAPAMPEEVQEHAGSEPDGWIDAAAAPRVERHRRADGDDVRPIDARIFAERPLSERHVVDVVSLVGETLGELAVPVLGTADGVRKEAVVDDADPHSSTLTR